LKSITLSSRKRHVVTLHTAAIAVYSVRVTDDGTERASDDGRIHVIDDTPSGSNIPSNALLDDTGAPVLDDQGNFILTL
jgi:hypothetical protein